MSIDIGKTIRRIRTEKGLSQGDIEKRTRLLRCYISRVENGHTVPSLETLQKFAQAVDVPISVFFGEDAIAKELPAALSVKDIEFLTLVQRFTAKLTDNDRTILLAMVRKFAQTIPAAEKLS